MAASDAPALHNWSTGRTEVVHEQTHTGKPVSSEGAKPERQQQNNQHTLVSDGDISRVTPTVSTRAYEPLAAAEAGVLSS